MKSILIVSLALLCGCQVFQGERDGKYVRKGIRLVGTTVFESSERVLTDEEHAAKLSRELKEAEQAMALEEEERQRLYSVESKEKRRSVLLWSSVAAFAMALAFVAFGAFTKGWKTGAGGAVACMAVGMSFLTLIGLLPMITWIVGGLVAVLIVRTLYLVQKRGVI